MLRPTPFAAHLAPPHSITTANATATMQDVRQAAQAGSSPPGADTPGTTSPPPTDESSSSSPSKEVPGPDSPSHQPAPTSASTPAPTSASMPAPTSASTPTSAPASPPLPQEMKPPSKETPRAETPVHYNGSHRPPPDPAPATLSPAPATPSPAPTTPSPTSSAVPVMAQAPGPAPASPSHQALPAKQSPPHNPGHRPGPHQSPRGRFPPPPHLAHVPRPPPPHAVPPMLHPPPMMPTPRVAHRLPQPLMVVPPPGVPPPGVPPTPGPTLLQLAPPPPPPPQSHYQDQPSPPSAHPEAGEASGASYLDLGSPEESPPYQGEGGAVPLAALGRPPRRQSGHFRISKWVNPIPPDPDDGQQQVGEQELATKMLQIQSKRFYIDVKQNRRGRFMKVAEIGADGRRNQVFLALSTAAEFRDHLSLFSDFYANLGPPNPDTLPEDGKLKSETMVKDNRRYYLDLKENSRGRFLRVSQTIARGGPRCQIAIPAQGMIEFRDALQELLDEFGTDDGGYKGELPEGRHMRVENKNFYFDIGQNNRGIYMRISEVKTNFRTAITIPEKSWSRFRDIFADYVDKMKDGGEKGPSESNK